MNMHIDRLLQWLINHNVFTIQALIGIILCLAAISLIINFFREKDGGSGSKSLSDIEATLKKVLESTQSRPSAEVEKAAQLIQDDESDGSAPAPAAAALAAPAAISADVEKLKGEVSAKDKAIADLKASLDAAQKNLAEAKAAPASAAPAADTSGLEAKIKELQARLAEYEIIEDDIANLSMYRTENAKLKEELEKLRGGAPVAPNTTIVPGAAVVPPKTTVVSGGPEKQDDILNEFASAVENVDIKSIAGDQVVSGKIESKEDPMAEFENAVTTLGEDSEASTIVVPGAAPAAKPAAVASTPSEEHNLLSVDSTKLMEEALGLGDAAAIDDGGGSALEASLNTDKLLEEANKIGGDDAPVAPAVASNVTPIESKKEEKKEDDANDLLSEFENFVKEKQG